MWSKALVLTLCCAFIQTYLDEDMLLFWRRSKLNACKPFTTYAVKCNRCVCGADAVEYCTKMKCFENRRRLDSSAYSDFD